MLSKYYIHHWYNRYQKLPLKTKCRYIFVIWAVIGIYITSEILSGEPDPIGLKPIAFVFYYGLWLLAGLALLFGIGLYGSANKSLGVVFYILAIVLSYQVLEKYTSHMSYILFMKAVDYNLVSLDSLVEQWRANELPLYKSSGIEYGLNQGKDISSPNLTWILERCLKTNNDCFLQLWAAFNSGKITSEQISKAYNQIKQTEKDPCKHANAHSKNLINYPLTPVEVLYDLRSYCKGASLKDLNDSISLREHQISKTGKAN